jgi:hypothetical protein
MKSFTIPTVPEAGAAWLLLTASMAAVALFRRRALNAD